MLLWKVFTCLSYYKAYLVIINVFNQCLLTLFIAVIHSIEPLMASPKEGKLTEESMILNVLWTVWAIKKKQKYIQSVSTISQCAERWKYNPDFLHMHIINYKYLGNSIYYIYAVYSFLGIICLLTQFPNLWTKLCSS